MAALSLSACTNWTPAYKDVAPLVGPVPYLNRTPMHAPLVCLRGSTRDSQDVRLGVADFVDGSGASMGDNDVNGRYFSQRPDLMLIVALSKTGVRLVNRTSTAVAEWEMRQAMDRRLGDGKPVVVGQTRFDYRPVRAGELLGSTYYVNGAITEINWSLSSNVEEAGFLGATAGRRTYRVSIAIDIVVTNSLTTEVVFARSYSKQLVGNETGAGVFRFVEASVMPKSRVELFQANIGQKQNEPVQQALRWLVELAGYEVVTSLTGGDVRCDALVPGRETEATDEEEEAPESVPGLRAQGSPRDATPPDVSAPMAAPPRSLSVTPTAPWLAAGRERDGRDGRLESGRPPARGETPRRDQTPADPPALPAARRGEPISPPADVVQRPAAPSGEVEPASAEARERPGAQPSSPAAPIERPQSAGRRGGGSTAAPAGMSSRPQQDLPWFTPATTRASGRGFGHVFGASRAAVRTVVARGATDE
jgi:curli production assembly/transport component CsgG/holdfast attachment protein HfaB